MVTTRYTQKKKNKRKFFQAKRKRPTWKCECARRVENPYKTVNWWANVNIYILKIQQSIIYLIQILMYYQVSNIIYK